jgi:uncharacterized protein YbaP (TraB family)
MTAKTPVVPLIKILVLFLGLFIGLSPELWAADRGLFFQISDNKGNQLYLLGSFHVAKSDNFPFNQQITDAFARSSRLAVELEVDRLTDAQNDYMVELGILTPPETLNDFISSETQQLLPLTEHILPPEALQTMRPWTAAITLEMGAMALLGYSDQFGFDKYFMDMARQRQMPIVALETFEEQMSLFTNLTSQESDTLLRSTILEIQSSPHPIEKFMEAWRQGNPDAFQFVLDEENQKFPGLEAFNRRIILERNQRLANRLARVLEDNDITFAVIGAAHTVGQTGIPAIFAGMGFFVSQL